MLRMKMGRVFRTWGFMSGGTLWVVSMFSLYEVRLQVPLISVKKVGLARTVVKRGLAGAP
jgi:hypothetical protein